MGVVRILNMTTSLWLNLVTWHMLNAVIKLINCAAAWANNIFGECIHVKSCKLFNCLYSDWNSFRYSLLLKAFPRIFTKYLIQLKRNAAEEEDTRHTAFQNKNSKKKEYNRFLDCCWVTGALSNCDSSSSLEVESHCSSISCSKVYTILHIVYPELCTVVWKWGLWLRSVKAFKYSSTTTTNYYC